MNREIKTKVWDKTNKKWTRDYIISPNGSVLCESGNLMYEMVHEVEIELMQFTGLKDKNGMDIYEEDIIQDKEKTYQVFGGPGGFSINTFQDEIRDAYTAENALADRQTTDYVQQNCVVIGNIYENPDLIK